MWMMDPYGAPLKVKIDLYPRCSMYGIFTNICPKNQPNVGKYTIHGASGYGSYLKSSREFVENQRGTRKKNTNICRRRAVKLRGSWMAYLTCTMFISDSYWIWSKLPPRSGKVMLFLTDTNNCLRLVYGMFNNIFCNSYINIPDAPCMEYLP